MKPTWGTAAAVLLLVRVVLAQPAITTSTAEDFAVRAKQATEKRLKMLEFSARQSAAKPQAEDAAKRKARNEREKERMAEWRALKQGAFIVPSLFPPMKIGQVGRIAYPFGKVESVEEDGCIRVHCKFYNPADGKDGDHSTVVDFRKVPIADPKPGDEVIFRELFLVVSLKGTQEQQLTGGAVPVVDLIDLDEVLSQVKDKKLKKPHVAKKP